MGGQTFPAFDKSLLFTPPLTELCRAFTEGDYVAVNKQLAEIPDSKEDHLWSAFYVAVMTGMLDIAKLILFHPQFDVNWEDPKSNGTTPLIRVLVMNKDIEQMDRTIILLLLSRPGLDINRRGGDEEGHTALIIACSLQKPEILQLLFDHPELNVNQTNKHGCTALMVSCYQGYLDVVKFLLTHPKIDLGMRNEEGESAMTYARLVKHKEIVKTLKLHLKSKPNQKHRKTETNTTNVLVSKQSKTNQASNLNSHTNAAMTQKHKPNDSENVCVEETKKEETKNICWNCLKPPTANEKLSKCMGCYKARYCDQPCQENDWERHSNYCLKQQKRRKDRNV